MSSQALFLEIEPLMEIMAMERVMEYMLDVKKIPFWQPNTHKSKYLVFEWMKFFCTGNMYILTTEDVDGYVSLYILYIYIAPNYKTIFFSKSGNQTHQYIHDYNILE